MFFENGHLRILESVSAEHDYHLVESIFKICPFSLKMVCPERTLDSSTCYSFYSKIDFLLEMCFSKVVQHEPVLRKLEVFAVVVSVDFSQRFFEKVEDI